MQKFPAFSWFFSIHMNRLRDYICTVPFFNHHHHHHHHLALVTRISQTLSRHSSLSFIALGRSSGQHPVSSHSCWMYVRAGRPAFARPCGGGSIRVHLLWVRPCFSSSVLHVTKSQKITYVSYSWMDSDLCIYHLSVWSNFYLLHSSQ